jgi:predicted membrane protein
MRSRTPSHVLFGAFLVIAGMLMLLNNLGIIFIPSLWRLLWPAFIIWAGFNLLRREPRRRGWQASSDFSSSADSSSADDVLNLTAILGGAQHRSSSSNFSGANVTAFMGGVNLDLREAKIGSAPAVIDVFAMMGSLELMIPADWTVESQATPLLGGFDDKTIHPADTTKRLIIRGTVLMGGITVKN